MAQKGAISDSHFVGIHGFAKSFHLPAVVPTARRQGADLTAIRYTACAFTEVGAKQNKL